MKKENKRKLIRETARRARTVWVWDALPLRTRTGTEAVANLAANLEVIRSWVGRPGSIWNFPNGPIRMPFYVPTRSDRETLLRHGLHPQDPDWDAVEARLLKSGHLTSSMDLSKQPARRLVAWLDSPPLHVSLTDAAERLDRDKGTISRWCREHPEIVVEKDKGGRPSRVCFDALKEISDATPRSRENAKRDEEKMERVAQSRELKGNKSCG